MSLRFSNTSSPYNGIIQGIETEIYGTDGLGRISSNTTLLAIWTTKINLAYTDLAARILQADGRWQFDDSNHTDYPTITIDLVANQRDYSFTTDENGHLVLDIYRVYVKASSSDDYRLLSSVEDMDVATFFNGNNATGTPIRYGKKANGVFVDPVPSANVTAGLKIEISREGSLFTTSDTTKKPGFDARLHEYLVVKPVFNYALTNDMPKVNGYQLRVQQLERLADEIYSQRSGDDVPRMTPAYHNNR